MKLELQKVREKYTIWSIILIGNKARWYRRY